MPNWNVLSAFFNFTDDGILSWVVTGCGDGVVYFLPDEILCRECGETALLTGPTTCECSAGKGPDPLVEGALISCVGMFHFTPTYSVDCVKQICH